MMMNWQCDREKVHSAEMLMIPEKPRSTWCRMFCLANNHILESDPWIQIYLLIKMKVLEVTLTFL